MFRRIRHPYQTYFPDIGATTALLRGFHATTGTHNALDLGGDAESTFDPFGNRKRQKDSARLPHEMGSKSQVKHYSIIKEPQGNGIVEVRAWLGQSPDGEGTAVEIEREARAQILKLTQLSRRAVEGHAGTPAPLPMWMQSEAQKHYRDVQPQDAGNARPDLHDHDEILMHPIAIMPDVHFGNGTTVGTVIPTFKAVIPSAVGVDIGCGMLALKTSLRHADLCGGSGSGEGGKDQILANLRMAIEIAIPHGRTHNGADTNDAGGWRASVPSDVADIWESELKARFQRIIAKYPTIERSNNVNHLGTLGTGNHFIEICVEEDEDSPDEVTSISKDLAPNRNLQAKHSDIFGISEAELNEANRAKERELRKQRGGNIWILLHSGSRGVGGKIGSTFIDIAKRDMGNHYSNLPNGDLAYLREGNPHFEDYCEALSWAQDYARWNRELMATRVLKALRATKGIPKGFTTESKAVNCHHITLSASISLPARLSHGASTGPNTTTRGRGRVSEKGTPLLLWTMITQMPFILHARALPPLGPASWRLCLAAWELDLISYKARAIKTATAAVPTGQAGDTAEGKRSAASHWLTTRQP